MKPTVVALIAALVPVAAFADPGEFEAERVKVTVASSPTACEIELQTVDVPLPSKPRSPTATELLNPVLDVFERIKPRAFLGLVVTNQAAFATTKSLAEAPSAFEVVVAEKWRADPQHKLTPSETAIAKRAMTALSRYRPAQGEITGRVCVDLGALYDADDEEPRNVVFDMPARELTRLSIEDQGFPRSAAVTLERSDDVALHVARFEIIPPVRVRWDHRARALLASGAVQKDCVLRLVANTKRKVSTHDVSVPVPQDATLRDARFIRVRVGKESRGVLGVPVLYSTAGAL